MSSDLQISVVYRTTLLQQQIREYPETVEKAERIARETGGRVFFREPGGEWHPLHREAA